MFFVSLVLWLLDHRPYSKVVFLAAGVLALIVALLPTEVGTIPFIVRIVLVILLSFIALIVVVIDTSSDRVMRYYTEAVIKRAYKNGKQGSLARCANDESSLQKWLLANNYGEYVSRSLAHQLRLRGIGFSNSEKGENDGQ